MDRRRQGLLGQHREAGRPTSPRATPWSASRCSPSAPAPTRPSAGCGSTAPSDDVGLRRLVDRLFGDPNLARDATYEPADGDPIPVRVVARRADAVTEFGEARLWSETTRFDVRVSEVASPRPGDRLVLDGETFVVQGEPVRDRERLVWTLDVRPE